MRMTRIQTCLAVVVLLFALPVGAATKEEGRVADAADVLGQFLRIPEQSIPPAMLSRAYAVAVVPNVVRIGFGLVRDAARAFSSFARTTTPGAIRHSLR